MASWVSGLFCTLSILGKPPTRLACHRQHLCSCKSALSEIILSRPATCRLFERELHYIVNHAEDEYIILDVTFIDLVVNLQQKMPTVKGFIILSDRQHMPRDCKLHNVFCYEDLLEVTSLSGSTFRDSILTAGLDLPLCLAFRPGCPSRFLSCCSLTFQS